MRRLRYFILGPIIVAMAFTLHSTAMMVVQIIAGLFYTALGFLYTPRKNKADEST